MSQSKGSRVLGWGIALLATSLAAATQAPVPPADAQKAVPPAGLAAKQEKPEKPEKPAAEAPGDYLLQRGDDVEIRAYNIPELNQGVKIRPDGKISVVILNDVEAAGLSAMQLGDALTQAYAQHFRNPKITVIVRSFTNQAIYVGGEVTNPRMLPLTGRMTVAAAIFSAGGIKETGKIKEVILLRDSGQGKPIITRLDLRAVLTKGHPDLELKPFDVVFVPKTAIARIDQFVNQYLKQLQPISLSMGFSYVLGQQPLIQ